MKKFLISLLIFTSLMVLIKPWKWHVHIHNNHKTIAQMLELTSRQTEYEKMLKEENIKEVKPVLAELEKTTKIYKELIKNKADNDLIIAEKKKIDNLYKKYSEIQKNHMEQFEKMLTKVQKNKFLVIRTQLFLKD